MNNVQLYKLAQETRTRIEVLTVRAGEGKDLMASKEFVAYLEWSGLIRFLASSDPPDGLPFDGGNIKKQADLLLEIVQDQFKGNAKEVSLSLSQAELINRRLDLIAGQLSKVLPLPVDTEPRYAVAI